MGRLNKRMWAGGEEDEQGKLQAAKQTKEDRKASRLSCRWFGSFGSLQISVSIAYLSKVWWEMDLILAHRSCSSSREPSAAVSSKSGCITVDQRPVQPVITVLQIAEIC